MLAEARPEIIRLEGDEHCKQSAYNQTTDDVYCIPGQNDYRRGYGADPSSVKVVAESLRDNDAYDILKEKGRAPKNKLTRREGVEVGVDVEQFRADHADE